MWLFALFIGIPLIELILLIKIGEAIGAFTTILLIVLTGSIGALLVRTQGLQLYGEVLRSVEQGELPSNALLHALLLLIGGITLLTPGFLTDLVGLSLVLAYPRKLWVRLLRRYLSSKLQSGQWQQWNVRIKTPRS